MTVSLADKSILILAANGFDENQFTEIQRALTRIKAPFKIAAPEQGLVNGWQGEGWGHYFTVDTPIGSALGSDYDALVLVGGERSIAKLKANAHTRRIVRHFVEAGKPVSAIGAGVELLALSGVLEGRTVAALEAGQVDLKAAQAVISPDAQELDQNLLTATGAEITPWVEATLTLIGDAQPLEQAA